MNVKIQIGDNQETDLDNSMYLDHDQNYSKDIWPTARTNSDSGFKIFRATPSVTVENIQDIIEENMNNHF